MRQIVFAALLGSALAGPALGESSAPAPGVFIMGQARFTVLAPECIRIEYSTRSLFMDEPSLFAQNRQARFLGYAVEQSTGRLMLDTGRIRLTYTMDGWPLSIANLKAEIRRGTETITWTPQATDDERVDGVLSRGGWHLVDDSDRPLLRVARPAGHGTDWFLFGYGLDYKAALRALAAVTGSKPPDPVSSARQAAADLRLPPRLRSILFPYAYASAWQANADSLPLLRPLYIEYPAMAEAYLYPQEYLYGDALLAATGKGRWLPPGDWYDWSSGERIEGPAQPAVKESLYARGGIPLLMQPFTSRLSDAPLKTLVLRAYPGLEAETGRAVLYEGGGGALTNLSYLRQGDRVRIIVEPTEGSFTGQLQERAYTIELPGAHRATRAMVERQSVDVAYSAQEKLNRISLPARDIRQGFTLYVWLP